jgi:hypothetical protein
MTISALQSILHPTVSQLGVEVAEGKQARHAGSCSTMVVLGDDVIIDMHHHPCGLFAESF